VGEQQRNMTSQDLAMPDERRELQALREGVSHNFGRLQRHEFKFER